MRAHASFALAAALAGCLASSCADQPSDGGSDIRSDSETAESRATRCAPCHLPEYRRAHPVHVGEKPTTCHVCHGQDTWRPSTLRHEGMALTGKHAELRCFACHTGETPKFMGTAKTCVGCHAKDDAQMNARAKWHEHFPDSCQDCHQTNAWKPAKSEPGFEEEPPPPLVPTVVPPPIVSAKPKRKPRPPPVIPTIPTTIPTTAPTTVPTTAPTTAPTAVPTTVPTSVPPDLPDIISEPSGHSRRR